MTYRDDGDAILARADALEDEVARLKEERDSLAAERDSLAAERDEIATERDEIATERDRLAGDRDDAVPELPTPDRATRQADRAGRRKKIIIIVAGVLAVAALVIADIAMECNRGQAHDRWKAAVDARTHHRQRWSALISVEPCIRHVAYDATVVQKVAPDRHDPRTQGYVSVSFGRLAGNCTGDTQWLVDEQETTPAIRADLQRWLDAEAALAPVAESLAAYYSNRDWVEDDLRRGRSLWADAQPLLAERRAIFDDLRTTTLPALRAEMRELQVSHEATAGRDAVWWRIELGLALWDINDRSFDVIGVYAGRAPDSAAAPPVLREPVARLLTAAADAPIEVRRDLRKIDWITGPLREGRLPAGETPLWHLAHPEADLLRATRGSPPAMPPDPGPEPHRD